MFHADILTAGNREAAMQAVLASINFEASADEESEESTLEHSIAHRSLKRLVSECPGIVCDLKHLYHRGLVPDVD
jgi:hypothetical protein